MGRSFGGEQRGPKEFSRSSPILGPVKKRGRERGTMDLTVENSYIFYRSVMVIGILSDGKRVGFKFSGRDLERKIVLLRQICFRSNFVQQWTV